MKIKEIKFEPEYWTKFIMVRVNFLPFQFMARERRMRARVSTTANLDVGELFTWLERHKNQIGKSL